MLPVSLDFPFLIAVAVHSEIERDGTPNTTYLYFFGYLG
jgi:hypothetical protein